MIFFLLFLTPHLIHIFCFVYFVNQELQADKTKNCDAKESARDEKTLIKQSPFAFFIKTSLGITCLLSNKETFFQLLSEDIFVDLKL